ncbi:SNF2-related protein [Algoriphagus sp.]|uniref:DEAD/DEAH box helicase n=1 Tax=Algoriphagus sp. TaxID=1872435 RepID=UPI00260CD580|nr:SNF2-related protein [Algoriphagus sp.]
MAFLTPNQSQLLNRLISKYPNILMERGENIYFRGQVDLLEEEEDEYPYEDFGFLVEGSSGNEYSVDLTLDLDNPRKTPSFYEDTFCDCPYFGDHAKCKHVAAAMIYLFNMEVNDPQLGFWGSTEFKAKPKGKEIAVYPTEFNVEKNELSKIAELLPSFEKEANHRIYQIQFRPDGIRYALESQFYPVEVVVQYDERIGVLKLTFTERYSQVIPAIYVFLKERFGETYQDYRFLTESLRKDARKDKLKSLGFDSPTNEDLEQVDFIFRDNKIDYNFSGSLSGLRSAESILAKLKAFNQDPLSAYPTTIEETPITKEVGLYNLGIVFQLGFQSEFAGVIPIIGKPKKYDPTGIETRLDVLRDPFDPRLKSQEGVESLLLLVDSINSRIDGDKEALWKSLTSLVDRIHGKVSVFRHLTYELRKNFSKRDLEGPLEIEEVNAAMKLTQKGKLYELKLIMSTEEKEFDLSQSDPPFKFGNGIGLVDNKKLLFLRNYSHLKGMEILRPLIPLRFVEEDLPLIFKKVIHPLSRHLPFQDESAFVNFEVGELKIEEQLYFSQAGGLIALKPIIRYGEDFWVNPLSSELMLDQETGFVMERNQDAENDFLDFIQGLHPHFLGSRPLHSFTIKGVDFASGTWFLEAFGQLSERGVKVFGTENLNIKRYSPFEATVSMQVSSGQDWFDTQIDVNYGKEKVPFKKLKRAWQDGVSYIQLEDGSLGKVPQEWMKKVFRLLRAGEETEQGVKLSKIHFMLLEDFEESEGFAEVMAEIESKKNKMKEFTGLPKIQVPDKLQAELRAYQKSGLEWFNFLREFGWGGILADDMGLGKTLQVIALLTQLADENTSFRGLIVVPTTLIFNWKKELDRFAPHLDYFIHHGERYDTVEELSKHQLVITSYGLVINDLEILSQLELDLIVADESQAIKNTSSLRYKALLKLKGKQRLALTGTPIENGIHELFAQMNFTNPGFFKTFGHFKENYLLPIKKGEQEVTQALKKQIIPFVLRRTKKEVLTELPEKMEEFLFCEMGAEQRKIYEAYKARYREFLLKKFDEEGENQSKMFVLEGLTKLRQICDSPRLIGESNHLSSSKIEVLKEHILEKTGNHKILVFSQFVKMLGLIQNELQQSGISYAYLDGKTSLKEREKEVSKFQSDDEIRVFLISLKAGGTGLNLTAADYVYIVDPWWNPAVENQAIDRCYRMGQEKHVMAYRMVCQESIEEKIIALKATKTQLADEVIAEGEGLLAGMDRETMLNLFS